MDEYINREAAIKELMNDAPGQVGYSREDAADCIRYMDAADVAPVRHGRWIERKSFHADGGISAKCSDCQRDVQYLGNPLKYCPNCGAKMDGGAD